MAVAEAPVKPAPARPAAAPQAVSRPGAISANTSGMAKAVAATPAAAKAEETPPPPKLTRHDLEMLSRQLVLALSLFAAIAAFVCAVIGKRPYISAAFCAATAALCTGAIGTVLGNLIIVQNGEVTEEPDTKAAPKVAPKA